ncbi:MAG: DUF881 domain-containing protein [Natronincolaceae bacterium]|jgi:uncharacterized protein YlxW (UPF0749 family)|nr:DUF881 domain-containing protein [Bacillota bacterium]NLK90683.1 DUF881 domain-containing protein [Clostridiales bacterium]
MKIRLNKIILLFLCVVLGFFIATQTKIVQGDYSFVSLRTIIDLQNLIKKEEEELSNISELIMSSKNRLLEYETAISEGGSIKDVLAKEHEQFKMTSGFVDLEGPGVIIWLSDSNRELYEWEDPNNVIVHDLDVLILVNDLKTAGAEAISINGQRIMGTSEIQCAGATITINNHTYGQPYIIRAIGDPDTLGAAVKSPESYASLLKDVYGLGLDVEIYENVKVPKFGSDINWKYLTPKEGE